MKVKSVVYNKEYAVYYIERNDDRYYLCMVNSTKDKFEITNYYWSQINNIIECHEFEYTEGDINYIDFIYDNYNKIPLPYGFSSNKEYDLNESYVEKNIEYKII